MSLTNSLGLPVYPRRKRRHGERRTIAAEAVRCPHCLQALRQNPIDAWGHIRAALTTADMTLPELRAATGVPRGNLSTALQHHAHEVTRTGKRGSYRYALKAGK